MSGNVFLMSISAILVIATLFGHYINNLARDSRVREMPGRHADVIILETIIDLLVNHPEIIEFTHKQFLECEEYGFMVDLGWIDGPQVMPRLNITSSEHSELCRAIRSYIVYTEKKSSDDAIIATNDAKSAIVRQITEHIK